jgi:DNA-binding Lrp family transcriptional regulator
MQTIFVQIKCDLGQSYRVAQDLADIDGISEVYSISGAYDLIVKCYMPKETDVGHFVNNRIQMTDGVKDTHTIMAFNAFS